MNRPIARLIVATLALTGALVGSAAAQNAMPALRANVTVTGDVVRIGDLIENCGPVADVPIFRAPDLGTSGAVATERVVEAIRPHQLIGIDTRGLTQVIVTRAARAIAPKEISARIAAALAGQYGLGTADNVEVDFDRAVHGLYVEPTVTGELQVVSLAYDPRTTRFDVTLDLPMSSAARSQQTRFTGTAFETRPAITVDHPIERGEILKASDLVMTRRPKTEGPTLADVAAVAGLSARHELRPGQPLRDADLMKPRIVQQNDAVTIVYEAPGFTLTLRGRAQEAGALGDTIGILNEQSKRVVQAVVSGPGRVTVTAAITRFVENAQQPVPPAPPPSLESPQPELSVE